MQEAVFSPVLCDHLPCTHHTVVVALDLVSALSSLILLHSCINKGTAVLSYCHCTLKCDDYTAF